uniref:Peroxisome biogenesis protein 3-1 n=1 Tax=Noccaea caerulescens TaxID=107243 RepID=A0A1J3GA37_NOCCA
MDLVRGFWRKHRRKILVTTTCLGSGYLLYKLYNAHTRKLADLERELANELENDEIIKTQMKAHFENIQMIADSTTLPHAMRHLSSRIVEEIHVSSIMEKLSKGKGTLTPSEKLQLWNELKILSFTRMVLSLWSVTMLSLYIRVQVNILGRHLYIDTARGLGSSHLLEELDLIDRDDEQKFLASADYLASNGMPSLISNMQSAVKEVLKGKQLKDVLTTKVLQETVIRILDVFMSTGSPHHWVEYLMMAQDATMLPSDTTTTDVPSSDATVSKFHLLITETREVLTSTDFTNVAEISLKSCTVALVEEMEKQTGLATGMQVAKLLPQIEKTTPEISAEPEKNRFLQLIRDLPEVQLFFTLLYSNMPL